MILWHYAGELKFHGERVPGQFVTYGATDIVGTIICYIPMSSLTKVIPFIAKILWSDDCESDKFPSSAYVNDTEISKKVEQAFVYQEMIADTKRRGMWKYGA